MTGVNKSPAIAVASAVLILLLLPAFAPQQAASAPQGSLSPLSVNAGFEATVPAGSRVTFRMGDRLRDCRAGVKVECLDEGAAVIAETATYSPDKGSGTNTVGGYSN